MIQFTIGQKQISVYPCDEPDRPVIYLNTFAGEGKQVLRLLRDDGCPPFTLVSVSSLDWNHDMSPWEIPPVFKNADPCTGGADDYLRILIERIVPEAEKEIKGTVSWRESQGIPLQDSLPCIRCIGLTFFQEPPVCRVLCGIRGLQNIFHRIL